MRANSYAVVAIATTILMIPTVPMTPMVPTILMILMILIATMSVSVVRAVFIAAFVESGRAAVVMVVAHRAVALAIVKRIMNASVGCVVPAVVHAACGADYPVMVPVH